MTTVLNGEEVAEKIKAALPEFTIDADATTLFAPVSSLYQVAEFLKNTERLDFNYLANLTAVDYFDYFEVIYNLTSLKHNHSIVLKTRCHDRDKAELPSVVSIWRAADYQERELFDLMGITFTGHPNLKRLFLWDGFPGHPLRKDFL